MVHNEHMIQRPFAVVTGASEWFGLELARQFAATGFDLLITGSDEGIHETREELLKHGVFVEACLLDLSTFRGVQTLYAAIKEFGHPVDALSISAEEGPIGPFLTETDLKAEMAVMRKNVLAPVHLMKLVLKDMVGRGHGKILVSSSLNRLSEAPYEAVNLAAKSFLFTFTEAVRSEIRGSGVTLTTLLPNLYDLPSEAELSVVDDPAEMAKEGFDALMAGRDYVFTATLRTKLQGMIGRLLPDKARTFISTTPS